MFCGALDLASHLFSFRRPLPNFWDPKFTYLSASSFLIDPAPIRGTQAKFEGSFSCPKTVFFYGTSFSKIFVHGRILIRLLIALGRRLFSTPLFCGVRQPHLGPILPPCTVVAVARGPKTWGLMAPLVTQGPSHNPPNPHPKSCTSNPVPTVREA